jgi:hypothetical protein
MRAWLVLCERHNGAWRVVLNCMRWKGSIYLRFVCSGPARLGNGLLHQGYQVCVIRCVMLGTFVRKARHPPPLKRVVQ